MKTYIEPPVADWPEIVRRPAFDSAVLEKQVKKILLAVQRRGDAAVKKFTREFDGVRIRKLAVSDKEIKKGAALVPASLKEAIGLAYRNIRRFHEMQWEETRAMETLPGIRCWRRSVGIEKVGIYIPGGTAPLFSTILMLGIPAQLAGCSEIVLCSPPDREGNLHPAILYAAQLTGITQLFRCGGVQAVGAMAYGTETIPAVYKIFGPGNQYVTCAKQLVQRDGVAIDMPAGPSEVAVYADETANPSFVAADLLSQAEHGVDSQVLLVAGSRLVAEAIQRELAIQLDRLPRKEIAAAALENSRAVVLANPGHALDLLNAYAPEHLILNVHDADALAARIVNAGSVFIGPYSPESAGDYASGTNHTLPTNGYAKMYSGVSVDSFVKKITFQRLTEHGLAAIGSAVIHMAEAEGLQAHAEAVRVRVQGPKA